MSFRNNCTLACDDTHSELFILTRRPIIWRGEITGALSTNLSPFRRTLGTDFLLTTIIGFFLLQHYRDREVNELVELLSIEKKKIISFINLFKNEHTCEKFFFASISKFIR